MSEVGTKWNNSSSKPLKILKIRLKFILTGGGRLHPKIAKHFSTEDDSRSSEEGQKWKRVQMRVFNNGHVKAHEVGITLNTCWFCREALYYESDRNYHFKRKNLTTKVNKKLLTQQDGRKCRVCDKSSPHFSDNRLLIRHLSDDKINKPNKLLDKGYKAWHFYLMGSMQLQ
jgi:hypothetical protein